MAPSPHGPYWKEGSQRGYQDVGSWTLFNSTPGRPPQGRLALRPVRRLEDGRREEEPGRPDLHPRQHGPRTSRFTERAPKLGGLIEFYRSPDRVAWTPTGINVPDYPKLAQLFWENIGDVNSGAFTPQQAMDRLAEQMDQVMARMQAVDESNHVYHDCGPRLNSRRGSDRSGSATEHAPWAKLDNEKPQGETIAYDELIKRWTEHQ